MKKQRSLPLICLCLLTVLSGCSVVGDKTGNISLIYLVMAITAVAMLAVYLCTCKKHGPWFMLLFICIPVVNIGYYLLSIAGSLQMALWANRLSYLGSVFLPLSMLMIILDATKTACKKWIIITLLAVAGFVFLITATPGICGIYYKSVDLVTVHGISTLKKVYGPLHILYLFYLLFYFAAMVTSIIRIHRKKLVDSTTNAVILTAAVFVNIGVWFIEQLVDVEFEILSISYVITQMFMIALNLIMQENQKLKEQLANQRATATPKAATEHTPEQLEFFQKGLKTLTPTEKNIFEFYVQGESTKQIMQTLSITENTLKFHNKNIYSKLGVKSRRQLLEIQQQITK